MEHPLVRYVQNREPAWKSLQVKDGSGVELSWKPKTQEF